jgi:aspartate kinase
VLLVGVDDKPGVVAKIFGALADQHIAVDMIIQSPSRHATDRDGPTVDVTFTVTRADVARTKVIIGEILSSVGGTSAEYDENVVKVSIVGLGMRSHAGVAAKMFALLAKEGVNIQAIATSEIKVSCLVESKYAELSVRALHDGFGLGA